MSMPALQERYWTADAVRALPEDGKRYECIDGELLVTPAPRGLHQLALREIFVRLLPYVDEHHLGELLWSPADIELEPQTLVQPDLFVLQLKDGVERFRQWTDIRTLLLAIEVLSPSTARYDRVVKRRFFQRTGVAEYWIVDLDAQLVERWRPGVASPEILAETLRWQPAGAPEPLEIQLEALFARL